MIDSLSFSLSKLGGVSEHETLGNVECYDPETNRWVVDLIPQMNYRRSGVGENKLGNNVGMWDVDY